MRYYYQAKSVEWINNRCIKLHVGYKAYVLVNFKSKPYRYFTIDNVTGIGCLADLFETIMDEKGMYKTLPVKNHKVEIALDDNGVVTGKGTLKYE